MEYPVEVRRYLNRTLIEHLGEDFVDNWFVEVLPNATHLAGVDQGPRYHRHVFFGCAYVGMAVVSAFLLEGFARCLNLCVMEKAKATDSQREVREARAERLIPRADTTEQPLLASDCAADSPEVVECWAAEQGEETEEEAIREHVRGYGLQDLFFIAYQHIYIFLCMGLTLCGFLNNYLCPATGLDYEVYFPWFVGTVLMHFVTLIVAFLRQTPRKALPMVLWAIPKTLNPFDGHLGTLRDAVAAGIYAQQSFTGPFRTGPLVLSGICSICIFLPNFLIYSSVHPFRDLQELYWPILIQVERHHLNQRENKEEPEPEQLTPSRCSCLASMYSSLKSMLSSMMSLFEWKSVLGFLDAQTRQHKQVVALAGDIPQAVVGIFFMSFYVAAMNAHFIVGVTVLAFIKTCLTIVLRPRILCCMAANGMGWKRLTEIDVRRAVKLGTGRDIVTSSRACRGLLKDPETFAGARLRAIKALAMMHDKIKKDQGKCAETERIQWRSELHSIEESILREYATSTNQEIQHEAETTLGEMGSEEVGHLMKRLRSRDLGDCAEAAVKLANHYPGYANAYTRDLVWCLKMELPPRPTESRGETPTGPTTDVERGPSDAQDRGLARREEANKKREAVLKVRDSAARSLGKLGDLSKEATDNNSNDTQKTKAASVAEAVAAVAPEIIGLLDEDRDVDLRMVALTAVVHFHGWAAVQAIEKAVKLLGGDPKEIRSKAEHLKPEKEQKPQRTAPRPRSPHVRATLLIAEILFIQLLRNEDDFEALQIETIKEVVKMLGSTHQGRREVAERVLFCTGGRTAQTIWNLLFEEGDPRMCEGLREMPQDKLNELEHVVKEQKTGVERLLEIGANTKRMNLMMHPADKDLETISTILKEISKGGDVFTLLQKNGARPMKVKESSLALDDDKDSTLAIFLTDLEPDDDLCITEVCSFLQETTKPCLPLIIFLTDLKKKDSGDVFALKLMLAALIVGQADYKILVSPDEAAEVAKAATPAAGQVEPTPPPAADEGGQSSCCFGGQHRSAKRAAPSAAPIPASGEPVRIVSRAGTGTIEVTPGAEGVAEMYEDNRNHICNRIQAFKGREIRIYVCAPCRGNLGAIIDKLDKLPREREDTTEFIKSQPRKVYFYSGTFNVEHMERSDLRGLTQLVEHKVGKGECPGVLTDVSKFPFFGGSDHHELAQSFTSFASPSFAPRLSFKKPFVAAVWKRLNDETNMRLIHPDTVFQQLQPEARWKRSYDKDVTKYAKELSLHPDFEKMVKKKKQMTTQAFACGVCDAPLCDQLLFVAQWAQLRDGKSERKAEQKEESASLPQSSPVPASSSLWSCCFAAEPSESKVKNGGPWQPAELLSETTGGWVHDTLNKHTLVDKSSMGTKARRPHMREAHSISAIYQIQQALQEYTFKHFENQEEMSDVDAQNCMVLRSRAAQNGGGNSVANHGVVGPIGG